MKIEYHSTARVLRERYAPEEKREDESINTNHYLYLEREASGKKEIEDSKATDDDKTCVATAVEAYIRFFKPSWAAEKKENPTAHSAPKI